MQQWLHVYSNKLAEHQYKGSIEQSAYNVVAEVSDEEAGDTPTQVTKGSSLGAYQPWLRDARGDWKKVLSQSLGLFKVYLCTHDPIPSEMGKADLADNAWSDVCLKLSVDLLISDDNWTTVNNFIYLKYTYLSALDNIWCLPDSWDICYKNMTIHDRTRVWLQTMSPKKHS